MKISAIIRMITGSLIAIFLVLLLAFGLRDGNIFGFMHNFSFSTNIGVSSRSYQNSEAYAIGGNSIAAQDINDIEVNWLAGNVKILAYEGDEITFSETSTSALTEAEKLRYLVKDGKLTIQFSAPSRGLRMFFNSTPEKTLELKVPQQLATSLNRLMLDSVSAQLDLQNISAKELALYTVSGPIYLTNSSCNTLTAESVSGEIIFKAVSADTLTAENVSGAAELNGSFNDLDYESVSGSVSIDSEQALGNYQIETVSGSIKLAIPENPGFTVDYETVSGSFSCDFPTTSRKQQAIYKDGKALLDLETVSGSIKIIKK